jgi:16S rRNA (guanine966-N2)-methyltransferase
MAILGSRIPDARVLDLFAGSGALGLEALSRGAREAVFVERAGGAVQALERNVKELDAADRARIVRKDAFSYVAGLEEGVFDLALADPPYERGYAHRLVEAFHRTAFASELWVEHRTDETLPDLPGLAHRRYGDTTLTRIIRPV